ncbi:hypothetical protein MY10362_006428 [Beauveria mimosiformis]
MDGLIRTSTTSSTFHSLPVNDEGTSSDHAHLALVPSSSSRASSVTVNEQDDYAQLPPTVYTHGWKSETMQPTVLLALALASVLLAALLEILAQKSAADGALCLVDTAADIPPLVSFAHLYLPTITAVLYSLAWNWVDLDVKRMQPWLQLSRSEGATGRDSLFLDYPMDFVAFVPFRAAKKRHWASFYSGTIVFFVFWVLTPMQGAVFGTVPVLARHTVNMSYPVHLVDASQQAAMLGQSILNAGYAVTWLNQALPPYKTPEHVAQGTISDDDAKCANGIRITGLSRPSSSFKVNLLLTSYLPTAFSTLVEPLWVLLNRFHCMLQPLYDLVDDGRHRVGRPHPACHEVAVYGAAAAARLSSGPSGPGTRFSWPSVWRRSSANVLAVGLGAFVQRAADRRPLTRASFAPQRQPVIATGARHQ